MSYYTRSFEPNARLDYKFVLNGSTWILDPLNPRTCAGGFGPNSELAMPAYIQPWEIGYNASIPHGALQNLSKYSAYLQQTYQIKVYLPPGYNPSGAKRYPTAYFHDGSEYISLGYANNIFDNLLDSQKIVPLIGVFVTPNNRNNEYAGSLREAYRKFFALEVVPMIDSLYLTVRSPESRLIVGTSYGANISALISYYHSNIFGKVGLHSAAFAPNNYEALNLFMQSPKLPLELDAVWGTYEEVYQYMRPFRDSMYAKGYRFDWLELPEGHSWGLWRATLDRFLLFFFPALSTGLKNNFSNGTKRDFALFNYPNPFNPITTICYELASPANVNLTVYSGTGKEIANLADTYKNAGKHSVQFNASRLASGIYYAQLRYGSLTQTIPLTVLK
jgi:enterochelin esterase family protein